MERTQSDIVGTGSLQFDDLADDIDDIVFGPDLFNEVLGIAHRH